MHKKYLGYFFIFLSAFIYGLYGIFTNFIADTFPPFYLSFFREGLSVLIIAVLFMFKIIKWEKFNIKDWYWFLLIGLISGSTNIIMYFLYQLIPIGVGTLIMYSTVLVLAWLFGILIFKEKVTKLGISSFIIVVIGLLIMFGGGLVQKYSIFGILLAIIYGGFVGGFGIISKKLAKYHPLQIYLIASVIVSILSLLLSVIFKETAPTNSFNSAWIWAVIWAFASVIANGSYIFGLNIGAELSIASVIMPMESVIAFLSGSIILNQEITVNSIIGGILIFIATCIPYIPEFKKKIPFLNKL